MRYEFTIPGEPKGKQRPRVTMRNGYAFAYTPDQTVNYENLVKLCYTNIHRKELCGPIRADITAYYSIPKSTSKTKRGLMVVGEIKNVKKPDCDNLAKIVLDSLNGLAYHDDSQVCELTVKKLYADKPRVVVSLTELNDTQGENRQNKEQTQ